MAGSKGPKNDLERAIAARLGDEFEYEPIRLPYTIHTHYVPDFVDVAGKRIVEGKGRLNLQEERTKLKTIKAAYPEWTIEVVIQSLTTKIYKGSKTTYPQWLERHGFLWSYIPITRKSSKRIAK